VTPQEVFDRMPAQFQPEKAGRTRLTVQYELTGEGGGLWWVRIADGRCTVGTGAVERPDLTFVADADDMVQMRLGRLHPMAATTSGRLQIRGQFGLAFRMLAMFRRD
jgi:putative sterol carrier protein